MLRILFFACLAPIAGRSHLPLRFTICRLALCLERWLTIFRIKKGAKKPAFGWASSGVLALEVYRVRLNNGTANAKVTIAKIDK